MAYPFPDRPAIACAVACAAPLALLLSGCAQTGEERAIAQCQRQSPPWLSAQCYELPAPEAVRTF
jgi:hypothetical protein